MRQAWLLLSVAAIIGLIAAVGAFAFSDTDGGRDGEAKLDLQDPAAGDPPKTLDLGDVERAIERVADVRRTATSQSRVAEDLSRQAGESVRWELQTTAFVEGVVFADERTAREAAEEVARIGGDGTTVIQVANAVTLMPDALVSGDQRAVGDELRRLRALPQAEADRV